MYALEIYDSRAGENMIDEKFFSEFNVYDKTFTTRLKEVECDTIYSEIEKILDKEKLYFKLTSVLQVCDEKMMFGQNY